MFALNKLSKAHHRNARVTNINHHLQKSPQNHGVPQGLPYFDSLPPAQLLHILACHFISTWLFRADLHVALKTDQAHYSEFSISKESTCFIPMLQKYSPVKFHCLIAAEVWTLNDGMLYVLDFQF